MTTEAETQVTWPKAKECQQLPEARSSRQQTLSWSLQKEPALLTP